MELVALTDILLILLVIYLLLNIIQKAIEISDKLTEDDRRKEDTV